MSDPKPDPKHFNDDVFLDTLAALPPVEYGRRRSETAKQLGITVALLDKEIACRRSNADEKSMDLPHWEVEPWLDPVAGSELLDALSEMFDRYVVLPKHGSVALALWVMHAWTIDASDVSPFMTLVSPEPRCGKTRVMTLLYWVTPRGELASNISAAAVFRYIEDARPTLIMDEADGYRDNEQMRCILNSGHTRTAASVIRCDGEDNKVRRFSTWTPKAVATIDSLAATLMDRSIVLRMQRKLKGEIRKRLRSKKDTQEWSDLRRKAKRWSQDHVATLADADPAVPDSINDRAADNWSPLLAIADEAGGEWPEKARLAAQALSGAELAGDASIGTQLLRDALAAFGNGIEELSSTTLLAELIKDPNRPWADWKGGKPMTVRALARMMGKFRVSPEHTKLGSIYRVAAIREASERYSQPEKPPPEAAETSTRADPPSPICHSVTNATAAGTSSHFQSVTTPPPVTDRKVEEIVAAQGKVTEWQIESRNPDARSLNGGGNGSGVAPQQPLGRPICRQCREDDGKARMHDDIPLHPECVPAYLHAQTVRMDPRPGA